MALVVLSSAAGFVTNKCHIKIRTLCLGALVRVSIAVIKHHDQNQFVFHFTAYPSYRKDGGGTQGRNLEAGTDIEAVEECYLLALSPWLVQPVLI